MKLKNNVAIVIGAGRGIGRAIALEFAREGAKVVLGDVDSKNLKEITEKIEHLGFEVFSTKCDVSKKSNVQKIVKKTLNKFGKIDILVNSAGIYIDKPVEELTEKEWNKIIDVKLKGAFLCANSVSEHMKKNKRGKLIFISSFAGEVGLANASAYSAASGGIINLVRELALELSPKKINVNAISPGMVNTEMTEKIFKTKKMKRDFASNIPWGRFGTPEEIADAAVFLASKDSDFITGHNLVVDGGWLTH